ncbi:MULTISPECIES: ATP-binding protein [unclassified Coleofasciculus]|uniref:ATP-binding protein n=1 Tax=unclassified Coleofasciculus TaxID=2692782 RepID=UPI0018825160|nr:MULTISPECIES: ATP-binding protein [unclassified Coleofasciculus]MBE9128744.1 ATP-binding protein [Coleofasciculus sp. LEGE 07081]MBE9150846.1 ATP-binding protein [Coleofasciculus sp. LEGE 07092]
MESRDALNFINSLLLEKSQPVLNELEESIFVGIWEGKDYKQIAAKEHQSDQYIRECGSKLCKKIETYLEIKVKKKNFNNPIEYLYTQYAVQVETEKIKEERLEQTDSLHQTSITIDETLIPNPFIPQQARIDDPQLFFNRDREIRRVFEVLNSGSSVALIGEEGIGKSSLLWKICQLAESYLHSPRQPVFLDLSLVNDENDFYNALCHEVGIPEGNDYRLTRNLRDRRILLAIDNVEKMTWEGFTRGLRDRLRGLAEGSNAPLKLILAATEPLSTLFKDSQDGSKTSPMETACQEENLKPWDEATTRAFIDARLAVTSVRFTEEEIIQLVQESDGHPRQLMQLCYRTYSRYVEGGE